MRLRRKWFYLVIAGIFGAFLSALPSPPARSQTLEERFEQAVKAFDEGRFDDASKGFVELFEKFKVINATVLLNAGASEFMAQRYGKAMFYLHLAIMLEPSSQSAEIAKVQMERIRAVLNRDVGPKVGYVFSRYHDAFTALFSWANEGIATKVFAFSFLSTFVLLGLFRAKVLRVPKAVLVVLASFTLGAGVVAYGAYRVSSYKIGVVTKDAHFFEKVNAIEPKMIVYDASEVRVLGRIGDFVNVRLPSGEEGFLPAQTVAVPEDYITEILKTTPFSSGQDSSSIVGTQSS